MNCQRLADYQCKYENFSYYKMDFDTFKNGIVNSNFMNGEYNNLHDVPFKYINILRHIEKLVNNNKLVIKNMMDPGCAYSSLSAYISKLYSVSTAYLFDFDIVSGKNILHEQNKIFNENQINTKVQVYGGDYFSNVCHIPDNSIDLVIDGCSITHFCGNKGGNSSWNNFCKLIYPKLTNDGYIIISTDIKHANNVNDCANNSINENDNIETIYGATEEFLYPNDIIKIFNEHGFVLVETPIISNDKIILTDFYPLRVVSLVFAKRK